MSDSPVPSDHAVALEGDPLDTELARRLNAWEEGGCADADCTQAATAVLVECVLWLAVGLLLWGWAVLHSGAS